MLNCQSGVTTSPFSLQHNQQPGRGNPPASYAEREMSGTTERRPRGRPRKHQDAKAAARAASTAYRERRKARREAPEIQSKIIDLSVLPAWKVKK